MPQVTATVTRPVALVLALLIGTVACAPAIGTTFDDASITARVKTALLNDPLVGTLRIEVDTFKGVVTLSGDVRQQAQIGHAIAVAERIEGVREVRSQLRIVPPVASAARLAR